MTHHSSFRYGAAIVNPPSVGKSSELRVSYFDPATGEPCDEKPKPLKRKHAEALTAQQAVEKRQRDEAEAAQIMADMKARNRRRKPQCGKFPHKNGRSVMVDGVVYPSINAAGRAIGVDGYYLGKRLREGKKTVGGHDVRFVEDRR